MERTRKLLEENGVKCWMDICLDAGSGMKRDIYDSMAAAVQGAAVVICFLSRQYQLSTNCKLELKFAAQTGVPIVPVMLEDSGWKASDWLGIITAGALYTPLCTESDMDRNMKGLISQIKAAVGMVGEGHDLSAEVESDLFGVQEMRQELERLRADETPQSRALVTTEDGKCPLSALIPDVNDSIVVLDAMRKLVNTVISRSSKHTRVGFHGTGGIGKTTTSAWLCRNQAVRRHFDLIAWVALGHAPNVTARQRQLFFQLTGSELSLELSAEEKLLALQQAFSGRHCLLVLDDVWEIEHISHFAVIDETSRSRVLISSRVRGTLDNCEIVNVGLPTPDESIRIVMAAAGMAPNLPVPSEARDVVRLCKFLPLTLGIAGRLVKDLELQNDWLEVTKLMKEELSGHGEARSAEDGIIATSLRTLKGPHADSARALLRAFRLVPEDVKVPLEALAWLYQASSGTERPPKLFQLRRWTRILIDRCLVLPPIDTPSVHDMVLDYAEAQTTPGVTKKAHRRLIDLFRQGRPGPSGWDVEFCDGRLSRYIMRHSVHHVQHGWRADWEDDEEALSWLDDYAGVSQDAIPFACAQFLGAERVSQLAASAESEGEWWKAALRWSVAGSVQRMHTGVAAAQPLLKKCAAALEHVQPATPRESEAKASLELPVIVLILLVSGSRSNCSRNFLFLIDPRSCRHGIPLMCRSFLPD
eukprot:SAG11_NODE_161_length_14021_cov_36.845065_11_plen_702_part_00